MISQVFKYPADEYRRIKAINALMKNYRCIQCFEIGKSVFNRCIPCLRIGDTPSYVLYTAAYHGMEWINSILMLAFAERVCKCIEYGGLLYGFNIKTIIEKRGIMIVPCVNPDGVEISLYGSSAAGRYYSDIERMSEGNTTTWQANGRGVDINHNFNAGWNELHTLEKQNGITAPGRTRYGGEYPESEPETAAITRLCRRSLFDTAYAFHSQGEVIYWDYGNTPSGSKTIAELLSRESGYEVSAPSGLAVGGGFKDWFITEFNRPAFTIETGMGKNPLPLCDALGIYKKIEKMLVVSMSIYL